MGNFINSHFIYSITSHLHLLFQKGSINPVLFALILSEPVLFSQRIFLIFRGFWNVLLSGNWPENLELLPGFEQREPLSSICYASQYATKECFNSSGHWLYRKGYYIHSRYREGWKLGTIFFFFAILFFSIEYII